MGDFNKIEGVHEIPVPSVCSVCNGTKKVGDEQCPACEGSGEGKSERSLKLRGRIRNVVKAEFEDWLEYRARRRVFDMRDKLEPEEFKESMDALTRGVAAYTFSWGGDAFKAALMQLPGQVQLMMLLAKDADRLTKEKQQLNEQDMINWMRHPKLGEMFASALKAIQDASPNFHAPPVRGTED